MSAEECTTGENTIRQTFRTMLFDIETTAGMAFNATILVLIMLAVIASMASTVVEIQRQWGNSIAAFERGVLVFFAIEYMLRIYAAEDRWRYIRSFNGIVDLITVLPLLVAENSMVIIRILRLARVIRVAVSIPVVRSLFASLKGSMRLLGGVLLTIALISILVGNLAYILEPQTFRNAFEGTWWSLVTMSTVGYGDVVPHTPAGKLIATLLILSGICMFAMVTAVISVKVGRMVNRIALCASCRHRIADDFSYCPYCASPQPKPNTLYDDLD